MRILAISPMHDASVAVVSNGKVEAYFKEERLSRRKHDPNPYLAFEMAMCNLLGPIDLVVFAPPVSSPTSNISNWSDIVRKRLGLIEMEDFGNDHHLQHAYLAKINSGWRECAVIVVDRVGSLRANNSLEAETIFEFRGLQHRILQANTWRIGTNDMSIVRAYEAAGSAMGVGILDGGKVMGLSGWGDGTINERLWDGEWNTANFTTTGSEVMDRIKFVGEKEHSSVDRDNYKHLAKLAAWVQNETQQAMKALVQKCIDNGLYKICITGGYGLNIVTNSYLVEQFPNAKFYFEPMADDSGNSIGAALYMHDTLKKTISKPVGVKIHGVGIQSVNTDKKTSVVEIAKLLQDGTSVGIVQGKAEAGPRALGNRSLLFNALLHDAKDRVNKIKNREWYRPFACMVLEDEASRWFLNLKVDKNMTRSYVATDYARKIISGVIHVDGTCRVQTVDRNDGVLYELLTEFKKLTGQGVLLNTSLNLAGDALVETVEDAKKMVDDSSLDLVWFPEYNCYY